MSNGTRFKLARSCSRHRSSMLGIVIEYIQTMFDGDAVFSTLRKVWLWQHRPCSNRNNGSCLSAPSLQELPLLLELSRGGNHGDAAGTDRYTLPSGDAGWLRMPVQPNSIQGPGILLLWQWIFPELGRHHEAPLDDLARLHPRCTRSNPDHNYPRCRTMSRLDRQPPGFAAPHPESPEQDTWGAKSSRQPKPARRAVPNPNGKIFTLLRPSLRNSINCNAPSSI